MATEQQVENLNAAFAVYDGGKADRLLHELKPSDWENALSSAVQKRNDKSFHQLVLSVDEHNGTKHLTVSEIYNGGVHSTNMLIPILSVDVPKELPRNKK